MTDTEAIRRCIAGCIRAKDGRGVYRNTKALEQRLLKRGDEPTIARMTAEAARAVGKTVREMAA